MAFYYILSIINPFSSFTYCVVLPSILQLSVSDPCVHFSIIALYQKVFEDFVNPLTSKNHK